MAKRKKRTDKFVLDSSVTLAWYFADEADPYANAVAGQLPTARAIVPGIWPLEVANVILMGERRKWSTEAQAGKWLKYLSRLPIEVEEMTTAIAWGEVVRLAREHNLSAYDAAYLELALRLGLPLATLDDRLRTALRAVGGTLYLKS